MLGAIIGDIVGSRFEFANCKSKDFELFSVECDYTDDTICTVAVADAILNHKDYESTLVDWCRRYPYPMGGYGCRFAEWVRSSVRKPYNSFGNGSAMRVSPVGWLFNNVQDVLEEAKKTAVVSHNHTEGIKGAESVAIAVYLLRGGHMKESVMDVIGRTYGYEFEKVDDIRAYNTFDETCQVTVPQAFSCFFESTDFEDAIRNAISIGGDSDTIGAITGSLAEAYYGIPEDIKSSAMAYLTDEMREIIGLFCKKLAS